MQLTKIEQHEESLGKEAVELIRIRLEILESTKNFFEVDKAKYSTSFDKQVIKNNIFKLL